MKPNGKTRIVLAASLLVLLASCLKEGNGTILVHDPQAVPFITDANRWPQDLLTLFGEDHVNFGDTPPTIDFAFKVSRQQYVATNLDSNVSPAIGSFSPVTHLHDFHDQYLRICQYIHQTTAGMGNTITTQVDTVYLSGHDSLFTAYFIERFPTAGSPVHAVILSGTLLGTNAVADYRYGYEILRYEDEDIPYNAYPPNSIFIFQSPDTIAITPNP
ncbi:MAG: hypothetical protein IKU00_11025 [Bacteroidales bacterium]|nr:hypothetical protein [Bacteroidales bacterium]